MKKLHLSLMNSYKFYATHYVFEPEKNEKNVGIIHVCYLVNYF